MKEADSAVPKVVRREHRHAGRLAGPRHRCSEAVGADAGEEARVDVTVLPWRQGRLERVGEHVG
jgi:hypothetical protein